MNEHEAKQAAYAAKRAALRGEPVSKVGLCGMAHPRPEVLLRFRVFDANDTASVIETTADNLMRRYGPAQGFVRWEVDQGGVFW